MTEITFREAAEIFHENLIDVMDAMASNLHDDINIFDAEYDPWMKQFKGNELEEEIALNVRTIAFENLTADRMKRLERLAHIIEDTQVRHPRSGRLTEAMIARAREFPIEDLYQGKLIRYGRQMFKGKCPFHDGGHERTPSFYIYTSDNHWYCYGCAKGGDAISFYQRDAGVGFPTAVRRLANIGI